ncbi:hypothetical protein AYO47_01825 [Planctomyces sp. SCGC AG-212-M04]|nr:hypothetical protein AYO47_01825 [Planctomyces sp. SCGC AG-212-M04]
MLESEFIDSVCDRFESELRRGGSPTLVEYVEPAPPEARPRLLYELLVTEIEFKVRRGASLYIDETLHRFPSHREIVFEAFRSFVWEGTGQAGPWNAQAGHDLMLRHFRLKALIGRGAFGNVWLADDTRLDREVAIKTCHAYDGVEPRELDSAICEAQAAATLRHANILPIYEVNEQDGCWFLVSSFAPNGTLQHLIESNPPSLEEAVKIVARLADALHHAHLKGVCHRDLKPSNILVDGQGEPLIADFGLATTLRRPGDHKRGIVCGTRKYMAPEQQQGRFGGERADIYSLGVIIEDLLESAARAYAPRRAEKTGRLSGIQSRFIRRSLELIRLQCCQTDPADRYTSAQALAEDCRRISAGRPAREATLPWQSRGQWFICRHSTAIGGWLLALAGTLALAFSIRDSPPPNARRVRLTSEPSGCEVVVVALDRLTGEPDPNRIVNVLGRTPVETYLVPGDYLVEAIHDDQHFQEAYRHVPEPSEFVGYSGRYRSWKEIDDVVHLPAVDVSLSNDVGAMLVVEQADDLLVSAAPDSSHLAERLHVPAFRVGKRAFTTGIGAAVRPYPVDFMGPAPDRPTMLLSYDDAIRAAELRGLRLPSAAEWCLIQSQLEGLVVAGLEREPGRALWTASRIGAPGTGLVPPTEHPNAWTGRLLATKNADASLNPIGERVNHPVFTERDGRSRGQDTGFLGVRSVRPRRRPEDFTRSTPHLMTASGSPLHLSTRP